MTSLSQLRSRKTTVLTAMGDSRDKISAMDQKIERLQEASSSLETTITDLETSNKNVNDLTVDESKWKGTNKTTLDNEYDAYKDSVKEYVSKTEEAKETIDEEIQEAMDRKATYTTGLNNLEKSLSSLENQIEQAEKE